jgi:hypothetical protein
MGSIHGFPAGVPRRAVKTRLPWSRQWNIATDGMPMPDEISALAYRPA